MGKAKFKVGQKVWYGRGKDAEQLIIEAVHKNPLVPIHQYTFEGKGFACGEQSLRKTKGGRDLTLSECMVDDTPEFDARIATIASAKRHLVDETKEGFPRMKMFDNTRVLFKPSMEMCHWIKKYTGDKMLVHVDSGQGHFIRMMKMVRANIIGIEPKINHIVWLQQRMMHDGDRWDGNVNEILTRPFKDNLNLLHKIRENIILVFTRPKDHKNLALAVKEFYGYSEILLIAQDIESDMKVWKKLDHEGISEDGEAIYSLKREDG